MATTLKIIYTFFLALLVASFVGLGIEAFYPSPKMPEYPRLDVPSQGTQPSPEDRRKFDRLEKQYRVDSKSFQKRSANHQRDVSIISLVAAIFILIVSLTFLAKTPVISNGLLLGGVFTLAYGIVRGLFGPNEISRFAIVATGLAVTLVLGYVKFARSSAEPD